MAEILIATDAGACYGVERALKLVREAARGATGPIHTLGPLIHNPSVVAELEADGVTVVDGPEVEPGSTLVLRTHGITPEVERRAREVGAVVLDATCPFVRRAHRAAARLEREGYQVIVVGEGGHPEVEGTLGHAPSAIAVGSPEEAADLTPSARVGLVVQTTQSQELLRRIVDELVGRVEELRIVNTICEATALHQDSCARLSATVDVMVVVGGRNSANTTHLAEIARSLCPRTHHIEQPQEVEGAWFAGASRIGITAGASTPAEQIERVRSRIASLVG